MRAVVRARPARTTPAEAADGERAWREGRPAVAYATRVCAALALSEVTVGRFLASLDILTGIYGAAMAPPPQQLPGRRAIMERHAAYPAFRAVVATVGAGPAGPGSGPPGTDPPGTGTGPPGTDPPGTGTGPPGTDPPGTVAGFAYGFHGAAGQWWHDLVRAALAQHHGRRSARAWMNDSFEIAEVHVHPRYQGRGTGHAMLLRLAHGRPEQTAVLSTMDADTSAHRLYRGLGFEDLLSGFLFPGADQPYVVMGAKLPLPE